MNVPNAPQHPRRAAQEVTVDLGEPLPATQSTTSARRGNTGRFRKGLVAASLSLVLAGASIVGLNHLYGTQGAAGAQDASAAIPAAAADAAAKGFADRTEDASRNAVRANLTDAVADETAKDREAAIDAAVDHTHEEMTAEQAAERDRLMEADMQLVAQQADKLKQEAEQAAARMEQARQAAANMGVDVGNLTSEEILALTTGGASLPVKSNYRIGAGFGATGIWARYHTGQDFPAPAGTPVYAPVSGIVLSPTSASWAGTNIVIMHPNGGSTLYAHLSKRVVSAGQVVKVGDLIGYVGNTGRSFGAHLHFEYYKPGTTPGDVYSASNPMTFLRSMGYNG